MAHELTVQDNLDTTKNLLTGLELGIASLEDAETVNGLTAVLAAAQDSLSEASEVINPI